MHGCRLYVLCRGIFGSFCIDYSLINVAINDWLLGTSYNCCKVHWNLQWKLILIANYNLLAWLQPWLSDYYALILRCNILKFPKSTSQAYAGGGTFTLHACLHLWPSALSELLYSQMHWFDVLLSVACASHRMLHTHDIYTWSIGTHAIQVVTLHWMNSSK